MNLPSAPSFEIILESKDATIKQLLDENKRLKAKAVPKQASNPLYSIDQYRSTHSRRKTVTP